MSNGNTQCAPVIIKKENGDYGLGLLYPNGESSACMLFMQRNLCAYWRATIILGHLAEIKDDDLSTAYITAGRDRIEPSAKSAVIDLIDRIGQKKYANIMATPIPDEIIRLILDGQSLSSGLRPDINPINEEMIWETIAWQEKFSGYGIERPEGVRAAGDVKKNDPKEKKKHSLLHEGIMEALCWSHLSTLQLSLITFFYGDLDCYCPPDAIPEMIVLLKNLTRTAVGRCLPNDVSKSIKNLEAQLEEFREKQRKNQAVWNIVRD